MMYRYLEILMEFDTMHLARGHNIYLILKSKKKNNLRIILKIPQQLEAL